MSRPLRVVLDTNVIVSAMLWQGRPGELLALAGEGEILLYVTTIFTALLSWILFSKPIPLA
jgi:putative PIN family toxin of toxin-antitoxin system